jgi:hypothetical protein
VIIFSLLDMGFNPLKNLEDPNRKSVVYIFRGNKLISIRILKNVVQHGSSLSTSKTIHEVHFFHFRRHWIESCDTPLRLLHVSYSQWDTKFHIPITCISVETILLESKITFRFPNMTSINSYLYYNTIFSLLDNKLISIKYLKEPNKNNYA